MADRKFSRYNMRCGIVLRSQRGGMKLNGFDIPELDSRFLLLTATDIPGENTVNLFGAEVPLLASDTIDYPGQPLLVLFGPDYEGAELELEKIKVLASSLSEEEKKPVAQEDMLFYSWGLDEVEKVDEEKQKLKKTETTLTLGHGTEARPFRFDMVSWTDQTGSVHIQGPMQWNAVVKDTVARVTGKLPGSVVLHQEKFSSPYDEYLLDPAIIASFVAIAAIKTRLPCEIREDSIFSRPGIIYHMTTWTDAEDKPRHEEVDVTIDQGVFSIGGKELQRQVMTGILPNYDVASFKGTIRTNNTASIPSIFCGSIAYASASAAKAMHLSKLSSRIGTNPLAFLTANTKPITMFTDYAAHYDTRDMMARAEKTAREADYLRKWVSSHLQKTEFGLMGFRTGIGIAADMGISGFSNSHVKENKYQGTVTFTPKRHLAVSGTIPLSITQDKGVRDTLSNILSAYDYNDTLVFVEDTPETPDTGPNVFSSYYSQMLPRLIRALAKTAPLTKVQDPPFTMVFSTQDTSIPCEFVHSGHGAAVCEIILEKISLVPVVKHLWLNVSLDSFKIKGVKQKVKNAVREAFGAFGAKVAPDFTLDMEITEKSDDIKGFSSISNLVSTLVAGSYVSALWQAVGEKNSITLPATPTQIDKTLNGGSGEN